MVPLLQIKSSSPVTFHVMNQVGGTVTKTPAEHTRLANLENWEIAKDKKGWPTCKVMYVIPLESSSSIFKFSDQKLPVLKVSKRCLKQEQRGKMVTS